MGNKNCPFCNLVNNQSDPNLLSNPQDIFYQDDYVTAFISCLWRHQTEGIALVIPNTHYQNIYEIPNEVLSKIIVAVKKVSIAIRKTYPDCTGITIRQNNEPAGNQDIFHLHFHIIPRKDNDQLFKDQNRYNDKYEANPEKRKFYTEKLRKYFAQNL